MQTPYEIKTSGVRDAQGRIHYAVRFEDGLCVTQCGRAVLVLRADNESEYCKLRPPQAWGDAWSWHAEAEGICFSRG